MKIIIQQASLQDVNHIKDILMDAVIWMRKKGLENLWDETNTQWNYLSKQYEINQFYLAFCEQEAVGCVALTDLDVSFWPDIRQGQSLYIHKLAVKRSYTGQDISKYLIDYAMERAIMMGCDLLRLDCNSKRMKLRQVYERLGFHCVTDSFVQNNYSYALYRKDI